MIKFLLQRCFLQNFDKGNFFCNLPEDFKLQYCVTDAKEFDIQDEQADIIKLPGEGIATYKNSSTDKIVVVNYEEFIQSLRLKKIKSCDFVTYSNDNMSFFICNELSTGCKKNKCPDARYQFENTIRDLYKCEEIKKIIDNYSKKYCVLSLKHTKITSPDNMAGAFNFAYNIITKAEKLTWKNIEKYGFEIWEANLIIYNSDNSIELQINSSLY